MKGTNDEWLRAEKGRGGYPPLFSSLIVLTIINIPDSGLMLPQIRLWLTEEPDKYNVSYLLCR